MITTALLTFFPRASYFQGGRSSSMPMNFTIWSGLAGMEGIDSFCLFHAILLPYHTILHSSNLAISEEPGALWRYHECYARKKSDADTLFCIQFPATLGPLHAYLH